MRVIQWYLPAFDGDLNGGFVVSLLDNTLRALHYILDMRMFLAVPVLDRTDTHSTAYAEDVIAVTCRQETVVGIPVTLGKFELRFAFAIRIDGLFLIEIDAVRHEFGLHRYAVVVKLMICIMRFEI